MEAIALVLGQLILAPFLACLSIIIELGLAVFMALGQLLQRLWNNGEKVRDEHANLPAEHGRGPFKKWAIVSVWCSFGVCFLGLVIADFFFIDRLLKYGLDKVHQKSGIRMVYQSVSGHLLTGGFIFEGFQAVRDDREASSFDLSIDELEVRVNPLALALPTPKINHIRVDGLKGQFIRHAANTGQSPRKNFQIADLVVKNVALEIEDRTRDEPFQFAVSLPEYHTQSLYGDTLLFAVLFRSNGHGRLMEAGCRVETTSSSERGELAWTLEDLPVGVLGSMVGGPFTWMEEGTVGVTVTDAWSTDGRLEVHTQWELVLRDVSGAVPDDHNFLVRAGGNSLFKFLEFKDEVTLSFGLDIDPEMFKGNANLSATKLAKDLEVAMLNALAEQFDLDPDKVNQSWDKAKEGVTSILDKAREKLE